MSSAGKIIAEEAGSVSKPTRQSNPVALEVPVNATASRPGKSSSQRELFSEETETVLVFQDGAVIRLSAAVEVGQLLYLTNRKNNREVVCQVTRKRSFRPTSCYVELEFTEAIADFWGVSFSKEETKTQTEAEKLVEAAEPIGGDREKESGAPSALEVDQLRKEVESLRNQLQSLIHTANTPATRAPAPVVAMKLPLQAQTANGGTESPEEGVIAGEQTSTIGKEVATLPQSAPNFLNPGSSAIPIPKRARRGTERLRVVVAGAVALLAVVAGAAWHEKWIPYGHGKKTGQNAGAVLNGTVGRGPGQGAVLSNSTVRETKPASAAGTIAGGNPVEAGSGQTGSVEGRSNSTATKVAAQANAVEPPVKRVVEAKRLASDESAGASRPMSIAGRRTGAQEKTRQPKPETLVVTTPEATAAGTTSETEAKLLNAINPVYPPDAMRNYIAGDVRLEAVVDTKGRVRAMKVVSGPAALQAAAMEALRKYQYAPATRAGKAVESRVKVTVKFWFAP